MCASLFARVREYVFSLAFCLFLFSFLIEKCWLRLSPSVKWACEGAWPQIIMTFAVCFCPECHSVMKSTAPKKRENCCCSFSVNSSGYCAIISRIDRECARTHFFFFHCHTTRRLTVIHISFLPPLFFDFQPQGSKIMHSLDVSHQ